MSNNWILHVKKFAEDNNLNYSQALKHPDVKNTYGGSIQSQMIRNMIYSKSFDPKKVNNPSDFIKDLSHKKARPKKDIKLQPIPNIDDLENEIKQMTRLQGLSPRTSIKSSPLEKIIKAISKPEPKPEPKSEPKNDQSLFFSDYLECKDEGANDANFSSIQRKILNKMFDEFNKMYPTEQTKRSLDKIRTENTTTYSLEWVNKKENAGHTAEYSDFVKLVVYPSLAKENFGADPIHLMIQAHNITAELNSFFRKNMGPFNRCRVMYSFIKSPQKHPEVLKAFKKLSPDLVKMYEDYQITAEGSEGLQKDGKLNFVYGGKITSIRRKAIGYKG